MPKNEYHTPVLLKEAVDALRVQPNGVYVDCTFGGGGHSRSVLELLNTDGRLVAFDQDEAARINVPADDRVLFIPQNFRHLTRFLKLHGLSTVDGVLADLGVSSYQFDEPQRGFSIRYDADLDMRMDQRTGKTAAEILNTYDEPALHRLFEQFGEVTNAKTLARTIVVQRKASFFKTIEGFKSSLYGIVKGNPNKYFAQLFQALRIEVNDELGSLKDLLGQIPQLLKPSGRICVITFHSLEDRMVKSFFRNGSFEDIDENPFTMTQKVGMLKPVNKKPITPAEKEIELNPRARSAKLRVAERIDSSE